ncbi:hypothetical protein PS3A_32290 [Pseudomonas sp. 3A(2025)]
MVTLAPPSKDAIDVILQYAPTASSVQPDIDLSLFVEAVYATDFMAPFDWITEFPDGALNDANLGPLLTADASQLRKLLIAHLRLDRFLNGHLRKLLQSGYLGQLLARLKALRATL